MTDMELQHTLLPSQATLLAAIEQQPPLPLPPLLPHPRLMEPQLPLMELQNLHMELHGRKIGRPSRTYLASSEISLETSWTNTTKTTTTRTSTSTTVSRLLWMTDTEFLKQHQVCFFIVQWNIVEFNLKRDAVNLNSLARVIMIFYSEYEAPQESSYEAPQSDTYEAPQSDTYEAPSSTAPTYQWEDGATAHLPWLTCYW